MRVLRNRLGRAIRALDVGVPVNMYKREPLATTNRVLRAIGKPQVLDLDTRAQLLRAVIFIEDEAGL